MDYLCCFIYWWQCFTNGELFSVIFYYCCKFSSISSTTTFCNLPVVKMLLWIGISYIFLKTFLVFITNSSTKTAASLLHNTCFGIGVQLLSRFESMQVGLQWDNIRKSPSVDDVYTMSTVFGMFICDTVIYFLITW